MLSLAVGYGKNLIEAKERAIFFYQQIENRKAFRFVESQPGYNEAGDSVWVTTIWFETIEPTPEEKKAEEEKHHFIGSTDIDPNDSDWHAKWKALQDASNEQAQLDQETADVEWRLNTDEFPDLDATETLSHIADK